MLAGMAKAGTTRGGVGLLWSPPYMGRMTFDDYMPFALDNGAFIAWRDQTEWDSRQWLKMLDIVSERRAQPLWAAVPDSVGKKQETLDLWRVWHREIKARGWPAAFCVQDGMFPSDVPENADVVFVGGTDRWKFPNLSMWIGFKRVHVARVNRPEMFEACERMGFESIDGTGWFRDPSRQDKLPAIERFIQGHRNQTPVML